MTCNATCAADYAFIFYIAWLRGEMNLVRDFGI